MSPPSLTKFTSLNAKGLNIPEKRSAVMQQLWKDGARIVYLQETHFRADKIPQLGGKRFPHCYHSTSSVSKSKGVSILIAKDLPWQLDSLYSDPQGRFLILRGTLGPRRVTLANIYCPNQDQVPFLESCLELLSDYRDGDLILGGDFNVALQPSLDVSRGASHMSYAALGKIKRMLTDLSLIDIWRAHHPQDRDYSYFSHRHNSYSRIDFFLLSASLVPVSPMSTIGFITLSDHAPVSFSLLTHSTKTSVYSWSLNDALLQDAAVKADVEREMSSFFASNIGTVDNPLSLWAAHKCVIRGILIKHGHRLKKARTQEIINLNTQIQKLETIHKASTDPVILTRLTALRQELSSICLSRARAFLFRGKRTLYEFANKSGRPLANLLRGPRLRTPLTKIRTPSGTLSTLQEDISRTFVDYFSALYSLPAHATASREETISQYLRDAQMPLLSSDAIQSLSDPISESEFLLAIKHMKPHKAPGPDGYGLSYYKEFKDILSPHFISAFNAPLQGHDIPQDMLQAHITVIPKPDKDHTLCSNYRPISLLNNDIKIFAKIIANRLTPFLPELIHLDQVGFVPHREARDNTIRTLDLITYAQRKSLPFLLLSTDAEKAFDRIDWSFMMATLQHIGLPINMISWIASLYSRPSASVKINGIPSPTFQIKNGTRQGCPLSPLLFIISLEPLLRAIRLKTDITGIKAATITHKVAAYADDLLFFLTNPTVSLPNLIQTLNLYSSLSNYKINWSKSEALPIGLPPTQCASLSTSFQFKWVPSALKYLGILIPADHSKLFELNFRPFLYNLRSDLASWDTKLISWFGRCNALKMTILPKFLYLLQTIPILLPRHYLRDVRSNFIRFIWAHRPPRLAFRLLRLPKDKGGLGVPDPFLYYYASHLSRVIDWCCHQPAKLWVQMTHLLSPAPISGLPWSTPTDIAPLRQALLPSASATLTAFHRANFLLRSSNATSPMTPIIGHPRFRPSHNDPVFRSWLEANRFRACHFMSDSSWAIPPLSSTTPPTRPLDFWRTFQLRHFLRSLPFPVQQVHSPSAFDEVCLKREPIRSPLSFSHRHVISALASTPLAFISQWETDLQLTFSPQQLDKILHFSHHASISNKFQESSYKLLTRWYRTPTRLAQIYPGLSPKCWRCEIHPGDLLHIFWTCPKLIGFWSEVTSTIKDLCACDLSQDPGACLLHLVPISSKAYAKSLLRHLLSAARACIPILWKSPYPPTYAQWIRNVNEIQIMENLTASLHDSVEKHNKTWYYWIEFQSSERYAKALSLEPQ